MSDPAYEIFEKLQPGDVVYVKINHDSDWAWLPPEVRPPEGVHESRVVERNEVADSAELLIDMGQRWSFRVTLAGGVATHHAFAFSHE